MPTACSGIRQSQDSKHAAAELTFRFVADGAWNKVAQNGRTLSGVTRRADTRVEP
jgi:hypothetical protein